MSAFGDLLAGQAAQRAANYNANLMDRDAKVQEQYAENAYKVYENYDLPRFDYYAEKQTGALNVALAGAGIERGMGTAYELALENEIMIQTDRDMMKYNAQMARDQANNEAIMTRAAAQVERYRGRVAKTASYFQAASSLLTDYNNLQTARNR